MQCGHPKCLLKLICQTSISTQYCFISLGSSSELQLLIIQANTIQDKPLDALQGAVLIAFFDIVFLFCLPLYYQ